MDAYEKDHLKAVVLYPDGLARNRIMTALRAIQDGLGPDLELEIEWVSFDQLQSPLVRLFLTPTLETADILCFATRGHADLPFMVERWLANFSFLQNGERRLLAMLEMSSEFNTLEFSGAGAFLEGLARKHGMDFFPYYTPNQENGMPHSEVAARSKPRAASFL